MLVFLTRKMTKRDSVLLRVSEPEPLMEDTRFQSEAYPTHLCVHPSGAVDVTFRLKEGRCHNIENCKLGGTTDE